jgi:hypothetical protein
MNDNVLGARRYWMVMTRRLRTPSIALALVAGLALTVAGFVPIAGASGTTAKSVVKVWSPNHAKYCAATIGLPELWDGAIHKPVTARWELTYFEEAAVHAPTRQVHTEIGAMAIAFSHLMTDAAGLKLFTRHPEWAPPSPKSEDSNVRAFDKSLAPYASVGSTPLTASQLACSIEPPGTPPNAEAALATATTAYYVNVANGGTRAVTVAKYAAQLPDGIGEHVVASGSLAKFTFATGAPACVTLPTPKEPPPRVVSCSNASAQ